MIVFYQAAAFSGFGKNLLAGGIKGLGYLVWGILGLLISGFISWYLYKKYQNLTIFKTPCSLTILMENGTEKTRHDLRGGVFMNNNIKDFKIKIPKSRQPHVLGYMPDFSLADADGRLHFITSASGDRTIWQQLKKSYQLREKVADETGNIYEYDLISTPVPRETKQITVNAIAGWREMIDKKKLTAGAMMIGGFIIMVIAHLISLYIQTKIKCAA